MSARERQRKENGPFFAHGTEGKQYEVKSNEIPPSKTFITVCF